VGSGWTRKVTLESGKIDGFNSGMYVYESIQDILDGRESAKIEKKISQFFRQYIDLGLTLDQLKRIRVILEEDK